MMSKTLELHEAAKEALQKKITNESFFEYSIEESCVVAITDNKGIITYVNNNFCRVSNFTKDELIGQDYRHHVSGLHTRSLRYNKTQIVKNGRIWTSKLKVKTKDGSYNWVGAIIICFLNDKSKPDQYVVVGTDISVMTNKERDYQDTEKARWAAQQIVADGQLIFEEREKQKRVEELIIANRELDFQNGEKGKRAAELIIANGELVLENAEKGKRAAELIIANKELAFQNQEKEKRASEMIIANRELDFQNGEKGKRAAELIIANGELEFENAEKGKRAAELIIANKELAFQNQEKEKRAAELITAYKDLAFQNAEREKRTLELVIANRELVLRNEEKEKRAQELLIANKELKIAEEDIRKLNEDIRKLNEDLEQKVIERTAQLESVNKELESFSYSVSHDLRAPLRAVNGYAKILEEDYNLLFDDEGKRLLNIVQKNAKKMGVLIDDLLAFSRLGRKEINKSRVNMNELAASAIAELNTSANYKAEITVKDLHPVIADNKLMNQVWINFLSNAIKYSSHNEKPVINISSEKINDELIYAISDNGVGFDMQYANKLFGVFQRLHAAEDFEGTGVGLALVHRIITKHNGRVWANAEIGKGATFYFSLPDKNSA